MQSRSLMSAMGRKRTLEKIIIQSVCEDFDAAAGGPCLCRSTVIFPGIHIAPRCTGLVPPCIRDRRLRLTYLGIGIPLVHGSPRERNSV